MQKDDTTDAAGGRQLALSLAESETDIQEAQRLRYRVFADEMAAALPATDDGLDRDDFDPYCAHVLVRDRRTARVVGTYRVLTPEQARRAGGFYAETEFDLRRLDPLRARTLELGRACVDPEYRDGPVLTLLWAGVGRCIRATDADYVMGCASIPLRDAANVAASICRQLRRDHLGPPEWRVFPRRPFRLENIHVGDDAPIPPLIRGYLRMGAVVCGDPAWDPDFGTADALLLLPVARMRQRYANRFLRAS